jgi:hypothetical protein
VLPQLRPGVRLDDHTANVLGDVATRLDNARSDPSPYDAYFKWVSVAVMQLGLILTEQEMGRLVLTDGFRLVSVIPLNSATERLVMVETDARAHQWAELMKEILAWRQRWSDGSVIVVPDTNVYLHHEFMFDAIGWRSLVGARELEPVRVVMPMVVLDELDGLKGRLTKTKPKEHLRYTAREIATRFERPDARSVLEPEQRLMAATTIELFPDPIDHVRLPRNDSELADRSRLLADTTC